MKGGKRGNCSFFCIICNKFEYNLILLIFNKTFPSFPRFITKFIRGFTVNLPLLGFFYNFQPFSGGFSSFSIRFSWVICFAKEMKKNWEKARRKSEHSSRKIFEWKSEQKILPQLPHFYFPCRLKSCRKILLFLSGKL